MTTKQKISFILILFFITNTIYSEPLPPSANWLQEELLEKHDILNSYWNNRIMQYNKKSVDDFKSTLINSHFPKDTQFQSNINKLFDDAIQHKINFEIFYNTLKSTPLVYIDKLNAVEKLIPEKQYQEITPIITPDHLNQIQEYIKSKNLSVSLTLGSGQLELVTPNYPENQYQYPFAIQSVGKILTEVLVFMMIEQNVLSEQDLQNPVQLDNTVLKKLPKSVTEQLKKVTLYQLMIHQSGLGDYLTQYFKAIESGHPPVIQRAEDFLPFVDADVYPIGTERYSNAGLLLVGLAIKHAYEKTYRHPINYDVLLKNMLINTIGMTSFSILKPDNARYNLLDPIAPFIAGSPAGGYWMTSNDLAKLGQWIYQKNLFDSKFNYLIKKYGQAFFRIDDETVNHDARILSSSAFLSISLKTGAVIAIESNQPPGYGDDLKTMIQRHIFAKEIYRISN